MYHDTLFYQRRSLEKRIIDSLLAQQEGYVISIHQAHCLALLAALCCGVRFFSDDPPPFVQRYGLSPVPTAIGWELNTGSMRLTGMGWKPGLHIQDIQVNTKQGKVLLSASELALTPNLSDLFFYLYGDSFPGLSRPRT